MLTIPAPAQVLPTGQAKQSPEVQPWQSPEITSLPLAWWSSLDPASPDEFKKRMAQFEEVTKQKFQGLDGADLVDAQNLFNRIQEQVGLLVLALRSQESFPFAPIQTKDAYTLDELLDLREQWRDLEARQEVPTLRIEELKSQSALLGQRRDNLLSQYNAADVNSPARILLGLQRVSARLDYALNDQGLKYHEDSLKELQKQDQLLKDQLDFARARLNGGETDWQAIESEVAAARADAESSESRLSSLQHQLLEVLSAENPKPSLEALRKQQLIRESASQSLTQIKNSLDEARANWYRFHSGTMDPGFDIGASIKASRKLLETTAQQVQIWTAASQTTLISPQPETDLNARKNVELAHTAAQETLSIIKEIQSVSDDLGLVQEILASDMVQSEDVFSSLGTRMTLLSGSVWKSMQGVLGYDLFHIGDAPVTPGSIARMLLIVMFGFLLSWVIRHLLERLKNRRNYAKSSAIYTLGRILHYIIIITAIFAALGTIGLNFSNFALIAGALSVGIGFGLQSIVNNFVSGLILLFEGSLRVGDFIELDSGLRGTVKEINTRATVINTNDSVDVVVPNSEFVSTRLTNWTLREPVGRLRISFGVAYGSDKDVVKEAAFEAAAEVDNVLLHTPGREAQIRLVGFGDSSLDFELLVWVSKASVRRPGRTRAEIFWALETKLRERGIEIPFPQRDLRLRTGFDKLARDEDTQLARDNDTQLVTD
jgi:small-conductance mechanosensitive channel